MQTIKEEDWQALPEQAQNEVYDFFLFIKQRYDKQVQQTSTSSEVTALSNHSAGVIPLFCRRVWILLSG